MKLLKKLFPLILCSLSLASVTSLATPAQAQSTAFSDLNSQHDYYQSIQALTDQGLLKGYEDGTFRPNQSINRAEFTKIVLEASKQDLSAENLNCYSDVTAEDWFAKYVCYAKENNIISGYEDGTFKPAQTINLVEASKILVMTLEKDFETRNSDLDEPMASWYLPYLTHLSKKGNLPLSLKFLNQKLTRAEISEMTYRSLNSFKTLPSKTIADLNDQFCEETDQNLPENIDFEKVKTTWLEWNNQVRKELGLQTYQYSSDLEKTAIIWSEYSKGKGSITHKRPGQTAYYDYAGILAWFKQHGLTFENHAGSTYTENIGWDYYSCPTSQADCTEQLIASIRKTFNFFMSEKGKAYSVHYDSIVHRNFKELGLGVAVDPAKKRYYLTVHYATKANSNGPAACIA